MDRKREKRLEDEDEDEENENEEDEEEEEEKKLDPGTCKLLLMPKYGGGGNQKESITRSQSDHVTHTYPGFFVCFIAHALLVGFFYENKLCEYP